MVSYCCLRLRPELRPNCKAENGSGGKRVLVLICNVAVASHALWGAIYGSSTINGKARLFPLHKANVHFSSRGSQIGKSLEGDH